MMLPFSSSRASTFCMSNWAYWASRTPSAMFSKSQNSDIFLISGCPAMVVHPVVCSCNNARLGTTRPTTAGPKHHNSRSIIATLVSLFQQAGVQAVFSRHTHHFQYSHGDGIHSFMTGAGSKVTRATPTRFAEAHTGAWATAGHGLLINVTRAQMTVKPLVALVPGQPLSARVLRNAEPHITSTGGKAETGSTPSLRGRFFHKALIMHTLFPSMPLLFSPGASCGLRQGHGRLPGLVLPRWHRRPWFRDKTALRQGLVTQQRDHQRHPTRAQDAHQPQAGRPAPPRLARVQCRHVEPRAGRNRLVSSPTSTQQPPRRHGHGPPEPGRPIGSAHAGAVPLPARALDDFKARFDPGAPPLPAGITGLGRQLSQDQPRVLVALFPAGPHGADHLVTHTGDARATP